MPFEVTNQIIDAILHNEGRHLGREPKLRRDVRTGARIAPTPGSMANLKPDWCQLPPETKPGAENR